MAKAYTLGLYEKAMPKELTWKEKMLAAKEAGFDFIEISIDETDEKLARLNWSKEERLELVIHTEIHAGNLPHGRTAPCAIITVPVISLLCVGTGFVTHIPLLQILHHSVRRSQSEGASSRQHNPANRLLPDRQYALFHTCPTLLSSACGIKQNPDLAVLAFKLPLLHMTGKISKYHGNKEKFQPYIQISEYIIHCMHAF